jgi:hypothetical protein
MSTILNFKNKNNSNNSKKANLKEFLIKSTNKFYIINKETKKKLINNCYNILTQNFKVIRDKSNILIIYDNKTALSKLLKIGYKNAINKIKEKENPNIIFKEINFYKETNENIKDKISKLKEKDLVILIQSSSFRMSKYRWRTELYKLGLKIIEHSHLEKNKLTEIKTYINSIEPNLEYYLNLKEKLIPKLEKAKSIQLISSDNSKLEFKKLDEIYDNIAYFEDKENYGTRFPVGEFLTESLNLEELNGEFLLYAYPDTRNFLHILKKPFKCKIEKGILTFNEGPKKFKELLEMISNEHPEKKVMIRELGLGLNKNISRKNKLSDVSSFERIQGIHLSLGMKHQIYAKKLYSTFGRKFNQRYHIDVFLDIEKIYLNNDENEIIYTKKKGWII